MASSVIKNIPIEDNTVSFLANTSVVTLLSLVSKKWWRVVQFRFELATKQNLLVGQTYTLGALSGDIPKMATYIPTFRHDGGSAYGLTKMPYLQGQSVTIEPLVEIPSGVTIIVAGTYITN